jgi:hypothetical protein
LIGGRPATLSNLTASTNFTKLSENAVLIVFKLANSNSTSQTVDLVVNSDIYFDGLVSAPVEALSDGRGFLM